MNIQFYFKNIEPTDAIKSYVSEKIKKIGNRLHHVQRVNVRFFVEREKQTCEISIQADATVFHVGKSNTDLYAAIDAALDTLHIQVNKHHKKLESKTAHEEVVPKGYTFTSDQPIDKELPIASYLAPSKPMTQLEAISQLQNGKFKFFMFHEFGVDKYSLVYIRPDGFYSILSADNKLDQYKEHVVKVKNEKIEITSISLFPISKLTLSQASEQLEENYMEYIFFINEHSNQINVLFRKRIGGLALKQPEE